MCVLRVPWIHPLQFTSLTEIFFLILPHSFGSLRYPAKVMAFNPFLYSHSIFYFDDQKVEDLELWRPNEFVRLAEANDDDAFEFAVTGQTKDGLKVILPQFFLSCE